eukprot:jgi/Ulvmu1/7204/UM034_0113.1
MFSTFVGTATMYSKAGAADAYTRAHWARSVNSWTDEENSSTRSICETMTMSLQKPSAFATGEGPRAGQMFTSASRIDSGPRAWSFPQGSGDMPPTPTSFAPSHTVHTTAESREIGAPPPTAPSMSSTPTNVPGFQHAQQHHIGKHRISRHQSMPMPGDHWASLVKRQEAARLRKISCGLSRSASAHAAASMAATTAPVAPSATNTAAPTLASAKVSSAQGITAQPQHSRSSSGSMFGSVASSSQMSSMMHASIMQSSMMLTQMMNQRIVSNNAAFRHSHGTPNGQLMLQVSKAAIAPTLGQMQQMPLQTMPIPTLPAGAHHGPQGQARMSYNTMMPPRPAINMPVQPALPVSSAQHTAQQERSAQSLPQQAAASPPLEPSARVAAELVVTLGAKMKEICEHQTVLVEQMEGMRQKIDEKDDMIMRLQKDERSDSSVHERERVAMAGELVRLKQQVRSMQSLMEEAADAAGADAAGADATGAAAQLSELNTDSGGTEEDSLSTKEDDGEEEHPSTASTGDGRPVSMQSSLTRGNGRYYFKPMSTTNKKKRRDLDDLFKPEDGPRSTH